MADFSKMTYEDFVGSHGGRRTKALAGRFRQRKGLSITPQMDNAIMLEAARRATSLANRQEAGTANSPDLSVDGGLTPGKPLPGVNNDMLGPPDAPRIGGRTSPGTTPRARSNMPSLNEAEPVPTYTGPGNDPRFGPGGIADGPGATPAIKHGWTPAPGGAMLGPATAWNAKGVRVNPLKSLLKNKPKSRSGNVQRQF